MNRFASLVVSLVWIGSLAGCAGSGGGSAGWSHLGTRTVDARHDRDEIHVGEGKGAFTRIRIEVSGSACEMSNVVVHFANGGTFSPETRLVFRKGEASRVIDLPGAARNITKVVFRYGNLPRGGRARVSLHGK